MRKLFVSLLAIFMVFAFASCDPSSTAGFEGSVEEATEEFNEFAKFGGMFVRNIAGEDTSTIDFSNFGSDAELSSMIASLIASIYSDETVDIASQITITAASGTQSVIIHSDESTNTHSMHITNDNISITYTYDSKSATISFSGESDVKYNSESGSVKITNPVVNGKSYYDIVVEARVEDGGAIPTSITYGGVDLDIEKVDLWR